MHVHFYNNFFSSIIVLRKHVLFACTVIRGTVEPNTHPWFQSIVVSILFPIYGNNRWRGWLCVLSCGGWREKRSEQSVVPGSFFVAAGCIFCSALTLFTVGLWCDTMTVRCLSLAASSLRGSAVPHHLLMSGLFSAEVLAVSSHRVRVLILFFYNHKCYTVMRTS